MSDIPGSALSEKQAAAARIQAACAGLDAEATAKILAAFWGATGSQADATVRTHSSPSQRAVAIAAQVTPGGKPPASGPGPITTHILDTANGSPASEVEIELEKWSSDGQWIRVGAGKTNKDGRCPGLHPDKLEPAVFRITFRPAAYFQRLGQACFYPEVAVNFEIQHVDQHYHVPLLVSPFGYSTYRGS
mmetsp:Transcript_10606/g.22959  ORF Transcript_10606/g.22959 Transcript_10606/m.22959 type:complete len:190 (-) Transcript_10606:91-660(-)|eukprot:CAMPEP_0204319786 /NCGR_PEP_ID=MMETSP0469-20131031/7288_1 /ASSEMBLY_ACC=CAM_ASM_000384 /TAXON_ID=2969 /ORGANISM="Oxyrrhis marina" /LENGTH=189 /DNA_ID=CAMNT_0051300991 /DNA_START=42 /DNA_END=611 /DNA_ORIENTATION=-